MDPFVKHYQVLGLKEGCTETELEEAYQERSQAWNPENFSGNEKLRANAQEKLSHINAAYESLRPKISKAAPEAANPPSPVGISQAHPTTPPKSRATVWMTAIALALVVIGAALLLFWRTQW